MRKPARKQAPKIAVQNRKDARQKIEAKIAVLQGYEKQGLRSGLFVPKSLEQFRSWTDSSLNLQIIGSKSTLYQPWNVDLKNEVLRLIRSLASLKRSSARRKNTDEKLRAENKELKFTLKQLAGEMHVTRQELLIAKRENERKDQRIEDLKEQNSKLTAKLKERTGLYQVK